MIMIRSANKHDLNDGQYKERADPSITTTKPYKGYILKHIYPHEKHEKGYD